jgi:hypothetical protein
LTRTASGVGPVRAVTSSSGSLPSSANSRGTTRGQGCGRGLSCLARFDSLAVSRPPLHGLGRLLAPIGADTCSETACRSSPMNERRLTPRRHPVDSGEPSPHDG